MTPSELQLICQNLEYSDIMLASNARVIAWWASAGKRKKKNMKLSEFWPLATEQFHGSTKADKNMIEWFKKIKNNK